MAWSRRVLGAGDARVSSAPCRAKNDEEEHYEYASDDLASFADQLREAKDEPQRIIADGKIVARLEQDAFSGPLWNMALDRLVGYAYPIIQSWIATGRIFSQGARLTPHYPTGYLFFDLSGDEKDELTQETLARAVAAFRRALMEGKWEESRGASLATYFVGMCILQFANAYKHRLRMLDQQPGLFGLTADLADEMDRPQSSGTDVAHTVVQRVLIEQFLQKMHDPELRLVLLLRSQGYSYREAAERAGLTPKAVESRLARYRRNLLRDDAMREWVETHLHI